LIDRIRDRDAFVRLRRDGLRVRSAPMWCSFVADSNIAPPQVAFAVSRALGNAVTRNRLRRRLRVILSNADVPNGLFLFGGRPPLGELTFVELEIRVAALLVAAQHARDQP
jgi:ribonuclease P protein component